MIKFIGTDLDGTLLNSYSKISAQNVQAIRDAVNSGIVFAICSGRTLHSVNKFFEKDLKIPGYRVVLNGAVVVDAKGKRIVDQPLDHDVIAEILKRAEFSKFKIVLDGLNDTYIYDPNRHWNTYFEGMGRHHFKAHSVNELMKLNDQKDLNIYKVCFSCPPKRLHELQKKLESFTALPITISRSGSDYFEINGQDVTKLSALQHISEYETIPMTSFMCFGDYGNDLDMIKEAGYGVAMANAIDKVKDVAWNVTDTNNQDGVATMIRRVLNKEFN
ncbi:Cof-type HAD-IIB family hydrolase [Companilactobacillus bobalius]|uniref:HAD superfamily hydrolase n=2 Tax=Companilactobacillus bobalius TaxID=2801451 RepID=A0A0R1KHJ4_9LACO|nr:Cof-type HAD-IIB family hydrolase [Companilactobacillus bobalius]KRK82957.1 HAD superfamily hydrolase [Companilactobacillus bobalius DSM 19674]OVE99358.1 putative phosphatase YwtE [Companilactobacillus bobalius]GEO57338.1 haloacid dehalogenase [Companilactobacillus paralimentarius]